MRDRALPRRNELTATLPRRNELTTIQSDVQVTTGRMLEIESELKDSTARTRVVLAQSRQLLVRVNELLRRR